MVLVGFIARTHGNRGEVILKSETDFPESRFRVGARLLGRVGEGAVETLAVTAVRFQQGRPILGIAGFSSINDAERLTGMVLKVPPTEQDPLPAGSFYHHQLIGCAVVTAAGETVGKVSKVDGDGEATRLVVRGTRAEVLIPLAEAICQVDVAAKRIVITPPDGLLEVNGDWRE
ncbi:MAG TPA: ribosome maturation factor RimM [Vicinamibacterales bacterium]|nr:ribosome maturation factor RimM [Vicinamibacterales bacterium]